MKQKIKELYYELTRISDCRYNYDMKEDGYCLQHVSSDWKSTMLAESLTAEQLRRIFEVLISKRKAENSHFLDRMFHHYNSIRMEADHRIRSALFNLVYDEKNIVFKKHVQVPVFKNENTITYEWIDGLRWNYACCSPVAYNIEKDRDWNCDGEVEDYGLVRLLEAIIKQGIVDASKIIV